MENLSKDMYNFNFQIKNFFLSLKSDVKQWFKLFCNFDCSLLKKKIALNCCIWSFFVTNYYIERSLFFKWKPFIILTWLKNEFLITFISRKFLILPKISKCWHNIWRNGRENKLFLDEKMERSFPASALFI